ncbi:hypothetical protein ZWY2020_060046 [Hordeum vulgare]|nr:hypothetical protein ZWY2020_060046 [Hordeum vulgare]
MDGAAVRRQKFFKVLLPGSFESSLSLPPKFAAGLDRPPVLAVATLRDPTGRTWHVGLVRHGATGLRFDGRGWRSFVAGCGLSAGQLLVFDHLDGLDFAVEPFDTSGCSTSFDATTNMDDDNAADMESGSNDDDHHRRYPSPSPPLPMATGTKRKKPLPATASPVAGSCRRSSSDHGTTLRLGIEKPFHLQYMELTKTFCASVGWAESCTAELSVPGRGDRRWEVSVRVGSKGGMIMAGWEGFAWDNGLRISDVCLFTPLAADTGDQVVQVQVLSDDKAVAAPVHSDLLSRMDAAAAAVTDATAESTGATSESPTVAEATKPARAKPARATAKATKSTGAVAQTTEPTCTTTPEPPARQSASTPAPPPARVHRRPSLGLAAPRGRPMPPQLRPNRPRRCAQWP